MFKNHINVLTTLTLSMVGTLLLFIESGEAATYGAELVRFKFDHRMFHLQNKIEFLIQYLLLLMEEI